MEPLREAVWHAVPPGAEPERFGARQAFLRAHVQGGQAVLDLGCGDGRFSEELRDAGATPIAVDVSHEAVRRAQEEHPWLEVRHVDEGEPLPLEDQSVDVVWAGEVLEHLLDPVATLAEVRRVLRFGGRLLVTTPYHGRVATALLSLRGHAFDEHFDPRADHLRFFTRRTLEQLIRDAGFDQVEIDATGGPPLLRHALHACAS